MLRQPPQGAISRVDLDISDRHNLASRFLLSHLKSGRSVPILIVGDSGSNTSGNWEAQFLKKLGQDYGCNVKHAQYNATKSDYDAWESLYSYGVDRHLRVMPGKGPWGLPKGEVPLTSGDLDVSINFSKDVWHGKDGYIISRFGAAGAKCWAIYLGANDTFYLFWTVNGTDILTVNFNTVSVASNTDGTPYWYRITMDVDDGAGHYVAKLWTSPDGSAWTAAQTITGASATSIYDHATQGYIIASSLSVTAPECKFYEVRIRDGIDGKNVCPQPIESWKQIQTDEFNGITVEGTPTIYIYNSAIGGANLGYYTDDTLLDNCIPSLVCPLVITSLSYNDGNLQGADHLTKFDALMDKITTYLTYPVHCIVAPAPAIDPADYIPAHKSRVNALISYAINNRYDLLNLYEAFMDSNMAVASSFNADGIHLSASGKTFAVETAYKYFKS